MTKKTLRLVAVAALLLVVQAASAANYKIVDQQVTGGEGYTVLRVWGSDQEMGYGQGVALAEHILAGVAQVKALLPTYYGVARMLVEDTVWKPAGLPSATGPTRSLAARIRPGARSSRRPRRPCPVDGSIWR
jgi:hypothetical protein